MGTSIVDVSGLSTSTHLLSLNEFRLSCYLSRRHMAPRGKVCAGTSDFGVHRAMAEVVAAVANLAAKR